MRGLLLWTIFWAWWLPHTPGHASCRLLARSQPPGAQVYIDGQLAGTTPLTSAKLPNGQRIVSFVHQGFVTIDRLLACHNGQPSKLLVKLQRATGVLSLQSTPPGAQVFLNRRAKGRTPLMLTLPTGRHRLQLRMYQFVSKDTHIQIQHNQNVKLHIALAPRKGRLFVTSQPPGADVYRRDQFLGRTPFHRQLPKGTYTLIIRKNGFSVQSREVNVPATGVRKVEFQLLSSSALPKRKLLRRSFHREHKAFQRVYQALPRRITQGAAYHPQGSRRARVEREIQQRLTQLAAARRSRKPQDTLTHRIALYRLYRAAAWHYTRLAIRHTLAPSSARSTTRRQARRIATWYQDLAISTALKLLTQSNKSTAKPTSIEQCRLWYAVGLALQQRQHPDAAIFAFQTIARSPASLACPQIWSAYTQLGQLFAARKTSQSDLLANDCLALATQTTNHPTYALALLTYARLHMRKKRHKQALQLFARALHRTRLRLGSFASEEQRMEIMEQSKQELVVAYFKVGDIQRARRYFRKWGGPVLSRAMYKTLRHLIHAKKELSRKAPPRR